MDNVETLEVVSVKFSHAVFSLLSTHDGLLMQASVWFHMVQCRTVGFGMVGFCVSCKFKTM
jgi:hypothetical protein